MPTHELCDEGLCEPEPGAPIRSAPLLQADQVPSAAAYMDALRQWQRATGGFRRLPARRVDEKFSNWVQWSRRQYRNGTLNPDVEVTLRSLGIVLEAATAMQPIPAVYDRACDMVEWFRLQGESLQRQPLDVVRSADESAARWICEMLELAKRQMNSMLIQDLREMVPVLFETHLAAVISRGGPSGAPARGTAYTRRGALAALEAIESFHAQHGRDPEMLAVIAQERRLASWRVRWCYDLLPRNALPAMLAPNHQTLRVRLMERTLLHSQSARLSEWAWWSSCAKLLLTRPTVGMRWHGHLYSRAPALFARDFGVSLGIAWEKHVLAEHASGRIALQYELRTLIDTVSPHASC